MATVDALMVIVGAPVDSEGVRTLIAADHLVASTEPDLEEVEPPRSYLSGPAAGYQIIHCEGQVDTVFLYAVPAEGFEPFRGPLPGDLSARATRQEVLRRFSIPERSGEASTIPGLGRQGAWDRFVVGSVCVHFQYTEPEERIRLVSLMVAGKAP